MARTSRSSRTTTEQGTRSSRTAISGALGQPAGSGLTVDGVVEQPMTTPAPTKGEKITRHGTSAGRVGQIVTAANRWRENYNPLRGLTIKRVVELFELGQRGDMAYLQWTFRNAEMGYPTLNGVLTRCEGPLLNFDWEIKIKEELPEGATQEQAEKQKATLKAAYERVDNLKKAFKHLHLAEFRGYAHLQKWRDEAGRVYHLECLNQWCICRDGLEGNWFWNPDSRSTSAPLQFLGKAFCIGGDELPLEDFIIEECERPIDRVALMNFVRSNLCEKDADGFIEIYGIPGGVVTMPPNVPQGQESAYEEAAQKVAEGGSGALPNGASYTANDGPRGTDPFAARFKHLDEQVVLVGTGGKLTMLAESGSGTLAGGAHEDTFRDIADGRAQKISERFQRDFDAEVLAREHPGEPVLVYFKLGKPDTDSAETVAYKREVVKGLAQHELISRVVANQVDLKQTIRDTGVPVNEEYTDPYVPVVESNGAEVTGELVRDGDTKVPNGGDVIGSVAKMPNQPADAEQEQEQEQEQEGPDETTDDTDDTDGEEPDTEQEQEQEQERAGRVRNRAEGSQPGRQAVAEAAGEDIGHVLERLQAILEIQDDQVFAQKLRAFHQDYPQLVEDLLKDPSAARALQPSIEKGFLEGLKAKAK